ncbi:MAG: hypothetical protein ACR2P3_02445 [Geminicoccaceae bacterium]
MNRRRLIKLAALSSGGLSLGSLALTWLPSLRANTLFKDLFGDPGVAALIGRLHQTKDPGSGTRGQALVANLAVHEASAREQQLRECVGADLAALDVVIVGGWVMARSEADLCAAVHLDRSAA